MKPSPLSPQLPDEIWSEIITQYVLAEDLTSILKLRRVNHYFEFESVNVLARLKSTDLRLHTTDQFRKHIQLRILLENMNYKYSMQGDLKEAINVITDDLVSRLACSGIQNERAQILYTVCQVMTNIRDVLWWDFASGENHRWAKSRRSQDIMTSSFIVAMSAGYESVYRKLLSASVEIDFRTAFFKTPLQAVTALGRVDLVEMLLNLGADPSLDLDGCGYSTVESTAACRGDIGAIKVFFDRKRCLKRSCRNDLKIAENAASNNYFDVVDVILQRHNHDCGIKRGRNLFSYACQHGNNRLVNIMIDAGMDPNKPHKGPTRMSIVEAAISGQCSTVSLLLDRGAKVLWQRKNAFEYAAGYNHFDIVFMLLDRGIEVCIEYAYFQAARNGNLSAAQTILEKYDHEWPRTLGFCSYAYETAIVGGKVEMISWFVSNMGMEVNRFPDELNRKDVPMVLALGAGKPDSVERLFELGAMPIDVEEAEELYKKHHIRTDVTEAGKQKALTIHAAWKQKQAFALI